MRKYIFSVLFSFLLASLALAQTRDNIIWSSFQVKKKIDPKTSVQITPIVRFNEDVSAYQNSSIDLSVKRSISNGLEIQVLSRTWFVPDQTDRQFLWFDLIYSHNFGKIGMVSNLRWHNAFDVGERVDPDFLRWKTKFKYQILQNLQYWVAIEPWVRLNGVEEIQRIRYETGLSYKVSDNFIIGLGYRREESINLTEVQNFNHFLPGIIYIL